MLEKILTKQVIAPIVIIIISIILYAIISKIISKIFTIKVNKVDTRHQQTLANIINNVIKYFIIIIAIMMILDVYGVDTKALVASLGVLGLVIGLSLQDLLKDFVAGMSIIFESQYRVGDTVTINGFRGEVIYLGIKTTRLKSSNGEVKILSNRNILEVTNHSLNNVTATIDINIANDVKVENAEQIIIEIIEQLNKSTLNGKGKLKFLGLSEIQPASYLFKLTISSPSVKLSETQRQVVREIKLELEKQKIIPTVIKNG